MSIALFWSDPLFFFLPQAIKDVEINKHDKKRVFCSEMKDFNPLDCLVSKVKIVRLSPLVRSFHSFPCQARNEKIAVMMSIMKKLCTYESFLYLHSIILTSWTLDLSHHATITMIWDMTMHTPDSMQFLLVSIDLSVKACAFRTCINYTYICFIQCQSMSI